jgi:hypothetical protein
MVNEGANGELNEIRPIPEKDVWRDRVGAFFLMRQSA